MTFLALEHEIRDLVVEHKVVCKLIQDIDIAESNQTDEGEVRLKYVDRARYLKNLVENLHKKQKKVATEELSNENESIEEDKEQTPEKLEFLKALDLRPKTSLDEPSNRKSRRNRIPAVKHVVTYGSEFRCKTDSKSPQKKRLLRKKTAEDDRPSSTPITSNAAPSRFITQTNVTCEECRRTFKIHQVNNLGEPISMSRNICVACQVSIDTEQMINTIIDQTTRPKANPDPLIISPSVPSMIEVTSSSQTISRASSPGYTGD